jgi:hypothetical protein
MDYLDIGDQFEHDYDSGATGGNRYVKWRVTALESKTTCFTQLTITLVFGFRFATILLYFTDLGENDGGETVFTEAWPVGQAEEDHVDIDSVSFFWQDEIHVSAFLLLIAFHSCTHRQFDNSVNPRRQVYLEKDLGKKQWSPNAGRGWPFDPKPVERSFFIHSKCQ